MTNSSRSPESGSFVLIATSAAGTEAVVKRELATLGYSARTISTGRLAFEASPGAICRTNLWLRTGERVLIQMGSFAAPDFGVLFDATADLPWEQWLPRDASFPVKGRSHRSQLSSVPACQKIVKKAIVKRLQQAHKTMTLPETGPCFTVEVSLRDDIAMLTIDTTGTGLHKRGYRRLVGEAQLRETLAAAMIQLSYWKPGRVLADPFCGTGTIPIEAALLGRNIAPGLNRDFVSESWPAIEPHHWHVAREEARDLIRPKLEERLLGYDLDSEALSLARYHAEKAGVASDIHWQQRPFSELRAKAEYGCMVTNPPYGERMGRDEEIERLYKSFPLVLRRLPTWSHYILSSRLDLEALVGQQASRRRKLFNGPLECIYYQFHGPRPPRPGDASQSEMDRSGTSDTIDVETEHHKAFSASTTADKVTVEGRSSAQAATPEPAFGGLLDSASRQAEEFANRLRKRARHLRRWPSRRGITCYRLYERDVPEVPLVVDRYEDALHIAEFTRPTPRTTAQQADWLDLMMKTAAEVLEIPREHVFLKRRDRQRGTSQYERVDSSGFELVVQEAGLKFLVNLSDYLDTGLFLDHRITRQLIRDEASDKRVLNLFAYTGTFSVYAASGGAASTTSVDKSTTYTQWTQRNFELNGLTSPQHEVVRQDIDEFLASLKPSDCWDLIVVDPPTFSNTKGKAVVWDVQQNHSHLLLKLVRHLSDGGVVYFSTNSRRFKLEESSLQPYNIRDITRQTIPEDFRNERIHKCWRLAKR